ncbi:MAG TPA: alpha-hydroxy acid oxidase [Haliangium sp.]|nr:alpha-hydroxy acid oxidase [Haliangium sp.]
MLDPGRRGHYHPGMETVNVMDFERVARERLSPLAWDYYASGANDEITLRENRAAFDRLAIHYKVLVDVSARSPGTRVLGHDVSMPLLLAPTAFHRLAHPDGELATARAAGAAGTIMILSTLSNTRIEDVVAAASGPVWFQLYVYRDRRVTQALVERVEAAGCQGLVLTVDAPLLGRRERDVRNRFHLPEGLMLENMLPVGLEDLPPGVQDSGLAAYFAALLDPALSWADVAWLRSITRLPLVIKGIVRPDDALRAVDCGASAVMVSNHGGRQLDTSPATIDVLPAIVEAVGARAEILLDGGVRRGTDVLKAVALGARAVAIGRPVLWGLAAGGEQALGRMLGLLRDEIDLALALCGCTSMAEVATLGSSLVRPAPGAGR